jgi:two-component system NtrC family sensor kinase
MEERTPACLRPSCALCAFWRPVIYDSRVLLLQILQGPDRGKRFSLPDGQPQLIGRSSEALPLSDRSVSRRHAELTPDDGRWFLRDLTSANGTFVNGQRLGAQRVELRPGDQIRCGSTLLVFASGAAEADKPSPVRLMEPEAFDLTVEGRVNPSDESMVLGEPDPVRAAMDHLRVIYDLTALTSATVDRDQLLSRVMDLIFEEFKPDRGFILLRPADGKPDGPLDPAVVRYKVRPRTVDEGHIPVSRTIISHVIGAGEGILSTNAMNDTRFRSGDSVHNYGIRSAICVPVRTAQQILGVIHIDSSIANFTFTQSQLRLMNAIGQHAGLVLESSRLVGTLMHTERLATMGQVVASLAHSIKNILQAMRGGADAVELALNRGDLKLAREGWPILSRNLQRIYSLTLNLLAYSKHRELDIELAHVRPLIDEVAALIGPQCDRKRVGLIVDVAEDVPPVPMDVNAMHQAMMNLLSNAVDAAPDKTGVITIRATYDSKTRLARLSVVDNGPGVDPSRQEEIFEPFTSSKGQRGTGLGLAVTRKIAAEHNGRVELESDLGKGAAFTIVLPCDRPGLNPSDTRLPRPRQRAPEEEEEF